MTTGAGGLGTTLRSWRDRLTPTDVGLPEGRARRAAGLRREELAELAGVSVDYVVRLEQGRATTPSAQVAASLARALRLTRDERDHLYRLAGLQPPHDGMISDRIPPGIRRVLTRLGDTPAGVFSADWRLLWWNPGWTALLGDPTIAPRELRSLVRSRFPLPGDRGSFTAWPVVIENVEASDRAIVADLRRASVRYPDDPRLGGLLARTLAGNPRFAELWDSGAVGTHSEDHKTVHHPVVGEINVDCDVLADTANDLKVVVYTAAPGSEAEARLDQTRTAASAGVPASR